MAILKFHGYEYIQNGTKGKMIRKVKLTKFLNKITVFYYDLQ